MAVDIFATFAGQSIPAIQIPETALHPLSKGVEILSISMGLENQTTIGGTSGGAGSGKATFNPIVMTKRVDTTTPPLTMALVSGGRYDTVTFDFFMSGAPQAKASGPIYTIACKMVFVSKIQQSVSQGDDIIIEEITLQYGAIQIKSKPLNKDGTLGKEVIMQWSKVKNNNSFDVI
jgi:type VI secretion system secreted protein Hcp